MMPLDQKNKDNAKPIDNFADGDKNISASFVENLCLCQVCYMNYNETTKAARMLHCGHTFCTECIKSVRNYGNSAYLECPTCRSETKCAISDLAPNYLVMEMVRKFGFMGAAVAEPPVVRRSRATRRVQKIEEMIDESYRQLIITVKADLLQKFDDLKENMSYSTVRRELDQLCGSVEDAVRDAYSGYSESESDHDSSDSSATTDSVEVVRNENNVGMVENPLNQSSDESISYESSDTEDTSSGSSTASEASSYTSGQSMPLY
ncbi:unnamed protein product [Caenorhabditis sp. 36 PRJEB53466]|nr:unnamed protein product [Caenorhabditis sp. 36 PRJEB53466]